MISTSYRRTFAEVGERVAEGRRQGMYPFGMPFETGPTGSARLHGEDVILLSSNNYLGLAGDPRINDAIASALARYGSSTCASRLHNGTTTEHVELESELAQWLNLEEVMLFGSGFLANLGALGALGDKDTVIITDRLNHASIVDGQSLAQGPVRIFKHKDMAKLEYILQRSSDFLKRLIVTDGVFSMDGDIAPLDEIVRLAGRYEAMVMVDDAHALGVLGATGRGTGEHFDVDADVLMGAFSKSLAGTGGFVGGSAAMLDHLRHSAHSYVFSVSPPPALIAGARCALNLVREEPWRQEKLWRNTIRFRSAMIQNGFDVQDSVTPVIPIMIGDDATAMRLSRELLDRGVYVALAMYPAVPVGRSRFRATITAALEDDQIDTAVRHLVDVAARHGVLGAAA